MKGGQQRRSKPSEYLRHESLDILQLTGESRQETGGTRRAGEAAAAAARGGGAENTAAGSERPQVPVDSAGGNNKQDDDHRAAEASANVLDGLLRSRGSEAEMPIKTYRRQQPIWASIDINDVGDGRRRALMLLTSTQECQQSARLTRLEHPHEQRGLHHPRSHQRPKDQPPGRPGIVLADCRQTGIEHLRNNTNSSVGDLQLKRFDLPEPDIHRRSNATVTTRDLRQQLKSELNQSRWMRTQVRTRGGRLEAEEEDTSGIEPHCKTSATASWTDKGGEHCR